MRAGVRGDAPDVSDLDLSGVPAPRACAVKLPFLFIAAMYALMPATVNLSVYPTVAMPPATFRVLVIVPRHAENRQLCVAYSLSTDPLVPIRRSCQSMSGEQERRVRTLYWDVREAGEYEASATVTRMTDGRERVYTERQPFRVIGMEP